VSNLSPFCDHDRSSVERQTVCNKDDEERGCLFQRLSDSSSDPETAKRSESLELQLGHQAITDSERLYDPSGRNDLFDRSRGGSLERVGRGGLFLRPPSDDPKDYEGEGDQGEEDAG
jgi:hypothetical protein